MKQVLIATGLYRVARRAQRALQPSQRDVLDHDMRLYRSLVPRGALCFDIGANIGEKTEALLRIGARVVAVEPQPECVAEIHARCDGLGDLTVLQAVICAGAPIATLYRRAFHGRSSLREEWEAPVVGAMDVPALTLDALIERYGVPEYVKIDVEGCEAEVLDTLSQPVPYVSFEYHREETDRAVVCLDRLIDAGATRVNVVEGERSVFTRGWMDADEARRTLADAPPMSGYGDLFVLTPLASGHGSQMSTSSMS